MIRRCGAFVDQRRVKLGTSQEAKHIASEFITNVIDVARTGD
jgi:hypothetical protein